MVARASNVAARGAGRRSWLAAALISALLCGWLLGGCATTIPEVENRSVSNAFAAPETTVLGQFFQPEMDAHPGSSGITLLTTGETSFRARTGLANLAEKTIDAQYYIWDVDTSGSILAERVLRAADRGCLLYASPSPRDS